MTMVFFCYNLYNIVVYIAITSSGMFGMIKEFLSFMFALENRTVPFSGCTEIVRSEMGICSSQWTNT